MRIRLAESYFSPDQLGESFSLGYQEGKIYNGVNEEVGRDRERRNGNSRTGVNHINGVNMEEYRRKTRILTDDQELRIRLSYMVKNSDEEVGAQLQELGLSLGGSGRARAERLYRAWLRTVGIPGVPTIDVAGEELQTSHTELIMEEDDESGEPFESMIRTECIGITATQVTNGSILTTRGLEAAPMLANLTMPTHTNTRTNPMSTIRGETGVHHPTTETFVHTVTGPMMSTGKATGSTGGHREKATPEYYGRHWGLFKRLTGQRIMLIFLMG